MHLQICFIVKSYHTKMKLKRNLEVKTFKEIKYNKDFKKPDEKSLIQNHNTIEINQSLVVKLVEMVKAILFKYKGTEASEQVESIEPDHPSTLTTITEFESMHVERKKMSSLAFQNVSLRDNLLVLSATTMMKEYVMRLSADDLIAESERTVESFLIDPVTLKWIAKIAFLNTNMNAYWRVVHLREFLVSLLKREGFSSIQSEEADAKKSSGPAASTIKSSAGSDSDLAKKQTSTTVKVTKQKFDLLAFCQKKWNQPSDDPNYIQKKMLIEQSVEELKLGIVQTPVLGVCDVSSLLFSAAELSNNTASDSAKNSESLNEMRKRRSLKLLEDCIDKYLKYESSTNTNGNLHIDQAKKKSNLSWSKSESSKNNWITELQNNLTKLFGSNLGKAIDPAGATSGVSQGNNIIKSTALSKPVQQPVWQAIRLVTNATLVLTARELLIYFMDWALKKQNRLENLSISNINCNNEFELLQLMDILYYTENAVNYRLFIRSLIASIKKSEKLISKVSMIACDFMLPEYKLLKKVYWSSEDDHEMDSGKMKNKTSGESLYEENINFTMPNCMGKDVEVFGSKPNDTDKLSSNDSTLIIIFDASKANANVTNNALLVNALTAKNMLTPKIRQAKLADIIKYCLVSIT